MPYEQVVFTEKDVFIVDSSLESNRLPKNEYNYCRDFLQFVSIGLTVVILFTLYTLLFIKEINELNRDISNIDYTTYNITNDFVYCYELYSRPVPTIIENCTLTKPCSLNFIQLKYSCDECLLKYSCDECLLNDNIDHGSKIYYDIIIDYINEKESIKWCNDDNFIRDQNTYMRINNYRKLAYMIFIICTFLIGCLIYIFLQI